MIPLEIWLYDHFLHFRCHRIGVWTSSRTRPQIVEGIPENEENSIQDNACLPEEGVSVTDLDYKIKVVE